jgi:tellurite methyltransferase
MTDPTWSDYYRANDDRAPREMLLEVLDRFGPGEHEAIDLGCGSGIDTLAMLERGWRVFAADAEPEGIDRLGSRVPASLAPRLRTVVARMEDLELPEADLVWASYSLFFCRPEGFPDVWARIGSAIRPGGRFAGQLLGEHDTWATQDDISAFSEAGATELLEDFEIERFDEEDEDGEACSGPKHWHLFHVVARRPASGDRAAE